MQFSTLAGIGPLYLIGWSVQFTMTALNSAGLEGICMGNDK